MNAPIVILIAFVGLALAFVSGLSYVGWMAFRELGLGPWVSAGATVVAWVVLTAIGGTVAGRTA